MNEFQYKGKEIRQEFFSDCFDEGLARMHFEDCRFSGIRFDDILFDHCTFVRCTFSGCRLGASEFRFCAILNCIFRMCSMFSTVFDNCKLTGSAFFDVDAPYFEINGGDWSFTDLRDLPFYKMELHHINFEGADFTGCCMDHATISNCCMRHARFGSTSMVSADLRESDLSGSNLSGLILRKTKIDLQQAVLLAESLGADYEP